MHKGGSRVSHNNTYELVLHNDGNLVLYEKDTHKTPNMEVPVPIWASGTSGRVVDRVVMQTDGNLVMYPPDDPFRSCPLLQSCPGRSGPVTIWQTRTAGHNGSKLRVDDDGTIGIYDQNSSQIWSKP